LLRDSDTASSLAGGFEKLLSLPIRLGVLSNVEVIGEVFFTEEKAGIGNQAGL
jgi:hypothetical protein